MKISKAQIIGIADVIKNLPTYENMDKEHVASIEDIAEAFANMLAASNPAFKRERFIDYINGKCGPNGGKIK